MNETFYKNKLYSTDKIFSLTEQLAQGRPKVDVKFSNDNDTRVEE